MRYPPKYVYELANGKGFHVKMRIHGRMFTSQKVFATVEESSAYAAELVAYYRQTIPQTIHGNAS